MHVYGVREVTAYLRELFETDPILNDVWIAGEVSNVNRPASGHVYFTLKDGDAQVRAVFFGKRYGPGSATAKEIEHGRAVGMVSASDAMGEELEAFVWETLRQEQATDVLA